MSATVIGAGLAGCEAAWQIAERGMDVTLCDMKPGRRSAAHHAQDFAELVCSNSLKSDRLENASGLLKEEMRRLGSLIVGCADETRVKAGGALAVDRDAFSALVTARVRAHPRIHICEGEVTELPAHGDVIVATGPLTSDALAEAISRLGATLHFYDAAAPLVSFDSLDMSQAYFGSRHSQEDDYINCPLDKDEYLRFWDALKDAEQAHVHGFEDSKVFEGCMPVEVMARRGPDTLRFGPMRPIGLRDPATGKGAYAVLQLRRDNAAGSVYNLVGFQTHLLFGQQKRVFSMIPALHDAEFLRYGVMHRNTYLDSPRLLTAHFELQTDPRLQFAGQMTGVEGYVESSASGLMAGLHLARRRAGMAPLFFPDTTALGALSAYISNPAVLDFQPMNVNFGLFPALDTPVKGKRDKAAALSQRALQALDALLESTLWTKATC